MEDFKLIFIIGKRKNAVVVERIPEERGPQVYPEEIAEIPIIDSDHYLGDVNFLRDATARELVEIAGWVTMVNMQLSEKKDNYISEYQRKNGARNAD